MTFASKLTESLFEGQKVSVKSTPCWDFTKKLFLENVKPASFISICYLIDPNGPNTVSVNICNDMGQEVATNFSKKEILDIKSIAEANGLYVTLTSSEDENDFLFLEIGFTSPNYDFLNF